MHAITVTMADQKRTLSVMRAKQAARIGLHPDRLSAWLLHLYPPLINRIISYHRTERGAIRRAKQLLKNQVKV